jgi:branched-chain amino acid transport system permease protein
MDEFTIGLLTNVGLFSFLALSAYLLLLAGEMSFGQQAFFGVGAYAGGILTALYGVPLPLAALAAMALGALAALLVGWPTLRLKGLYFAMATLAAAEIARLLFELLHFQREIDGELAGPDGTQGFRGIRWIFEHGVEALDFLWLTYGLLAIVLAVLLLAERSRLGVTLRSVGEDPELAAALGVREPRRSVAASAERRPRRGAVRAPQHVHRARNFDIMLGVHSLAYALIGGLGTALGPLLGVALDIGVLEGSRVFGGTRMIVFGGLVALLLIVRPRGLLDEALVHRIISRALRRT